MYRDPELSEKQIEARMTKDARESLGNLIEKYAI
ncbi:MAG: hypothetical protein K0R92_1333 [Lachnospiraceae bacterium]|nr:hypothetical protein [Lachnospiraceae bacterium]